MSKNITPPSLPSQIVRPKEAAKMLGISLPTLYRIQDDLPPKVRLGPRAVGYRRSDIENFIADLPEVE